MNPIEHRLFSGISKHWAAEPLTSYDKMLGFIRNTSTKTGLVVTAYLDRTISNRSQTGSPTHLIPRPRARQNITAMELHHRAQSVKLMLRLR
jgi:hypothetical protein